MSILVVDDSRAMRLIVRRELRNAGYDDVVEAENGRVALETMGKEQVSLVLSDWNMPGMNGLEFLRALRSSGSDVIFGFVTSESGEDTKARALEAGADFVVTKPFNGEDLRHEIEVVLGIEVPADATASQQRPQSIEAELTSLLARRVRTSTAAPPREELARSVATYTIARGARQLHCVVEMPLAVALGCALALVPASQAHELADGETLPEVIAGNFHEVANVLTKFAPSGGEHCVLSDLVSLPRRATLAGLRDANEWYSTLEVEIPEYPVGRLGFVGL